jgi:hypothetical protein
MNHARAVCSGEGNIELDAPIYVMFSKERAMDDIPNYTEFEWYYWNYGSNLSLLGRFARRHVYPDSPYWGGLLNENRNQF